MIKKNKLKEKVILFFSLSKKNKMKIELILFFCFWSDKMLFLIL